MKKRGLLLIFMLLFSGFVSAKLITVTPSDSDVDAYAAIESAQAGDIVEIAPGTYHFRVMLQNHGTPENPIIIRAKDPANRPVWDLSSKYCNQWPGSYTAGDNGRGAWQIKGSNYIISDLIIRGSHLSDGESSGIRPNGAANITVRNCLIEDNDNGIVGRADNILYEYCEIRNNGNTAGDMTHNVYNHGGTITIRYCYIHDPVEGQNLHIRAIDARIEYNLIENAASYMGDIMTNAYDRANGEPLKQTMTLVGNIFIQKNQPANDGQVFVMYNDAQWPETEMQLNMFYNTFIGYNGPNSALVHLTNNSGRELKFQEAYIYNNIIYGIKKPLMIDNQLSADAFHIEFKNNWWSGASSDYASYSNYMQNSFFGTDPGFKDIDNDDYTLKDTAYAIGKADDSIGEIPIEEYYHETGVQMMHRARHDAKDIGAHESTTDSRIISYESNRGVCEPLPAPKGTIITVSTANELQNAVSSASPGTTILIKDGTYDINNLDFRTNDVTLRSESGNRDSVILDGNYQSGTSIITIRADNITIADITLQRAFFHGIHVQAGGNFAKIYNVHFRDEREQFIKGNPSQDGGTYTESEALDFGEVACSYFEMTDDGRANVYDYAGGCYTGGIDIHRSEGWVVRDNIFKDIYCTDRGQSALAEHAVHFWRTNKDILVERNVIINCARGIGFGMANDGLIARDYPDFSYGGFTGTVDNIRGIIRNNMILGDTPGVPGFDSGITLWNSYATEVYHNTVFSSANQGSTIETRFDNTKDYIIKNNLLGKAPWERSGSKGLIEDNYDSAAGSMFVDAVNGDLHLKSSAAQAIDKGSDIVAMVDIDNEYRDDKPDLGADEYGSSLAPPHCTPSDEICGNSIDENCNGMADDMCICTSADTDRSNSVETAELLTYIHSWKTGAGDMQTLINAIGEWKNGC